MPRKLVTSDGKKLKQVVKELGLSWWAVYNQIRNGLTLDEALNRYYVNPPVHRMYKDVSLRQYCKKNGLSYSYISRACQGMPNKSVEEIIDNRLWIKRPEPDTLWCKNHNIPYHYAKNRYRYHQIYHGIDKTFREFCKDYYKDCYKL